MTEEKRQDGNIQLTSFHFLSGVALVLGLLGAGKGINVEGKYDKRRQALYDSLLKRRDAEENLPHNQNDRGCCRKFLGKLKRWSTWANVSAVLTLLIVLAVFFGTLLPGVVVHAPDEGLNAVKNPFDSILG